MKSRLLLTNRGRTGPLGNSTQGAAQVRQMRKDQACRPTEKQQEDAQHD